MAQYKISDITNVYWAMNDGFKGGRDPMGIQNSSVATYRFLLPGMTNLTGHIRYYSLYCWLLYEYDKMDKEEQIVLHQYNFIRRAELVMAFVMKDRGVRSVIGADFIQRGLYDVYQDGVYDIASGADFESTNKKYWSFTTGAFGQYYLGSLIYYGLVKIEDNRFYLRNKGNEMAQAFVNSVETDVRDLFLDCILEGGINDEEIIRLQPIALNNIVIATREWEALNELLIKKDVNEITSSTSTLRRESIYLMLKAFEKKG